ncbi:MAG: alpha/beta hydrolase [Bdellovibrionaceae bacterium]|nr:alpha/beta hydrolase [Pseudobdellovibrionaceae bacterium]
MKNKIIFALLFFITHAAHANINEILKTFTADDGLLIRGKITYPTSSRSQKYPAVLFLHGSGPLDMNLWLPGSVTADGKPHKMFEVIAHEIGSTKYVTYRYNKRGVTDQPNDVAPLIDKSIYATGDVKQLISDAKSAIAMLRADPMVDPNKIILLGLSEGTALAPMIADQDKNIAALVLMSTMGRNLKDILYYQFVQRNIDTVRKYVDEDKNDVISESEAQKHPELALPLTEIDKNHDNLMSISEIESVLLLQYYTDIEKNLSGPYKNWYQQHFDAQPNYLTIGAFKGPILFLQGEIDAQTPLSDVLLATNYLQQIGNSNHRLITYPGLGHGFSSNIGPNNMVPTIGPISPQVITDLKTWFSNTF